MPAYDYYKIRYLDPCIRILGCGVSDERNTEKDSSVLVSAASCNYLYSGIWKKPSYGGTDDPQSGGSGRKQ